MAAVLYGGPTAMITGASACRMAGLRYVPDLGAAVRILVAGDVYRANTDNVRVTATDRLPAPLSSSSLAIPTAPIHRAALDAAREFGVATSRLLPRRANGSPVLTMPGAATFYARALRDVRALLCEPVQRGLTHPDRLSGELESGPRRGSGLARRALDDILAGCRSAPECELRDLVTSSEVLPTPLFNQPLPGYRRLRPDACWSHVRLVVEIDSAQWHRFGNAVEATEQRRALLASMGWLVIPVSPRRLRSCPSEVLAEIEAAYLSARAASP